MGIPYEIEVATIAIDEATILEIRATISSSVSSCHFNKIDNISCQAPVVVQWRQRNLPKKCSARSEIFKNFFSRFPRRCGCV